jgi:hypothetical protein
MNRNYKVKAVFKETNRVRTTIIAGKNEQDIQEKLERFGYKDPVEISEAPTEEPTEAQINYAKILKIRVPEAATKNDVSALIDRKKLNDSPPSAGLVEFANTRSVLISEYVGEMGLLDLVFRKLDPLESVAFFTFSVYRWLSGDKETNLDNHSQKEVFYNFAKEQLNNERLLKSLYNYSGAGLSFFGTKKVDDGEDIKGGSVNTIAYRECADFLHTQFGLKKIKKAGKGISTENSDGEGCLGVVLLLITSLVSIIILSS